MIPKKEVLIRRTEKAIDGAQENMRIFTPWGELTQWVFRYSGLFTQALKRGVTIRWIADMPLNSNSCPEALRLLMKAANFKLRMAPNPYKERFGIFDNKKLFITTLIKPNAWDSPALWTSNSTIMHILEDYFEMKWKLAKEYKPERQITTENGK